MPTETGGNGPEKWDYRFQSDDGPTPETAGDYPKWFWGLLGLGAVMVMVLPVAWMFLDLNRVGPMDQKNADQCLYNLRTLWEASQMHAEDHDGQLPSATGWTEDLTPYLQDRPGGLAHFKCPSLDSPYGYAMQRAFAGRRLTDINQPDQALVYYDSHEGRPDQTDDLSSFPAYGRHMGKSQALFADGSWKALTKDETKPYVVETFH